MFGEHLDRYLQCGFAPWRDYSQSAFLPLAGASQISHVLFCNYNQQCLYLVSRHRVASHALAVAGRTLHGRPTVFDLQVYAILGSVPFRQQVSLAASAVLAPVR